jgi:bifunctional non-homologous end joining protein LigD
LQNRHGQTIASPLSVRPLPGAPVSTPLRWSEVDAKLDPRRFTLRTVPARLAKQKVDPFSQVLELKPNLPAALGRLSDKLERTTVPAKKRSP